MKTAIVLQGKCDSGKTASMRLAHDMLMARHPDCKREHVGGKWDVRVVLTIQGVKVGIESQGDPGPQLPKSLEFFARIECDIIVTTCRSYGGTVDTVVELEEHGYDIVWIAKPRECDRSKWDAASKRAAEAIFEEVETSIVEILKSRPTRAGNSRRPIAVDLATV